MGKNWDDPNYFPIVDKGVRKTGFGNATQSNGFANGVKFDSNKKARDAFISFMTDVMKEVLRVLKPGAHGLVWSLPRTSHWTAMALEDSGFEIRDCVYHHFGSGFPKGLDISKSIDKHFQAEREVIGEGPYASRKPRPYEGGNSLHISQHDPRIGHPITTPATPEATQWQGWNTALKPSVECWWLIRKPLEESSITKNVLQWGTGALNIDASRIATDDKLSGSGSPPLRFGGQNDRPFHKDAQPLGCKQNPLGRWPSHLLMSHSLFCSDEGCIPECPIALMDAQSGTLKSGLMKSGTKRTNTAGWSGPMPEQTLRDTYGDHGGASRFFQQFHPDDAPFIYTPKASTKDRNSDGAVKNTHPTPKSQSLMKYLVRLITPPGGTVLDCFGGSGSTALACISEGFYYILVEQDPTYIEIAQARIAHEQCAA